MSTCIRLDLEILGSGPVMSENPPGHLLAFGISNENTARVLCASRTSFVVLDEQFACFSTRVSCIYLALTWAYISSKCIMIMAIFELYLDVRVI